MGFLFIYVTWLWTDISLKDPDGHEVIIYHAGENKKNPPWRVGQSFKFGFNFKGNYLENPNAGKFDVTKAFGFHF